LGQGAHHAPHGSQAAFVVKCKSLAVPDTEADSGPALERMRASIRDVINKCVSHVNPKTKDPEPQHVRGRTSPALPGIAEVD
jgi:hypothetical protein